MSEVNASRAEIGRFLARRRLFSLLRRTSPFHLQLDNDVHNPIFARLTLGPL
jgi:hypothetical protein